MQIVIILRKIQHYHKYVCSVSILQFSKHFQLIFDNNDKQIKQKMPNFFSVNFSELSKFFFLILLRVATLESKVAPTNRNSYQNKNNVVVTISCFVYQLSKKYCVYYVSEHLKYCSQINEY